MFIFKGRNKYKGNKYYFILHKLYYLEIVYFNKKKWILKAYIDYYSCFTKQNKCTKNIVF